MKPFDKCSQLLHLRWMFLFIMWSSLEISQQEPCCAQQWPASYELMLLKLIYPSSLFFLPCPPSPLSKIFSLHASCSRCCDTSPSTPANMKALMSQVLKSLLVSRHCSLKIHSIWRSVITQGYTTFLRSVNAQWLVSIGIQRPRPLAPIWNNSTKSHQIQSILWNFLSPLLQLHRS